MDLDSLVNGPVLQTFSETVAYGQGGITFALSCVYDEAWRSIELQGGRHGMGAPVSTTRPCIGCRAADFPIGFTPRQGDTVTRNGKTRSVSNVQPDGVSGWLLISLK